MRFFIIPFLLLFLQNIIAQDLQKSYTTKKTATGKAKKYYDKGMEYNLKGSNNKAALEFEKALKVAPNFIDAQIQWAAMKYDMKQLPEAEQGFEKVLAIDPAYQKKVLYVLGLTEMNMKKFDEAATHFDQYIQSGAKNETLIKKAKKSLIQARFSETAYNNPVPFEPKNLGDQINTTSAEYLPSLTADGETLVYTMRVGGQNGQEDFYISKRIDGQWQKGKPLEDVNTPGNEGAQSISADGKLLVFTACERKDGYGGCDLYFSEVVNNKWTKVANMGNIINSRARETQPSLSADGKALYFSSNRKGGLGGMDIWVSYRDESGKWTTPQNIGEEINTPGHDRSPFIHADGETLYFMSNGHPGMGGHDLFFSRKKADSNTWGLPQNLGYPINTPADESTLVISLDGTTAYFASDRRLEAEKTSAQSGEVIGMDLYSFTLYHEARPQPITYVKAKVVDGSNQKPIRAKVEFINLDTGKMHAFSHTDNDGEFLICLPIGKDYALNVSKKQYLFHSEHFALTGASNTEDPYLLEIALQPIPKETQASAEVFDSDSTIYKPVILKNVFFDTGSAALREASYIELNRLKSLLEENPGLHIQINGHTDNVGSEEDNMLLSSNRAKAVYTFLSENGIAADRLSFKGFGESQPIDTNETPEGKQRNRRTEFLVIK